MGWGAYGDEGRRECGRVCELTHLVEEALEDLCCFDRE